jgi:GAF domain-containing protein
VEGDPKPGPLPVGADREEKRAAYERVRASIDSLLEGEDDWVAAMATVACELHAAFDAYDWTGFYRAVSRGLLVVGPYQGGHGCLRIPFDRGVCGAAARTRRTQLVPDVREVADHIACSSSTRSEIVVPVLTSDGRVLAVLDVDSDSLAAFDDVDREALESICEVLGRRFGGHAPG